MRHTLPSGGWVELRDPATLRARDQKQLMGGVNWDQDRPVLTGLSMTDGLIALLVTAWELPYERGSAEPDGGPVEVGFVLPSEDVTVIDDLTMPDYGTLTALVRPVQQQMFPAKPDPSDYDNPTSPTEPASE